jgi:hypothetical protein
MPQGEIRTIRAYTDFTGAFGDTTWGAGEVPLENGVGFVSVNEGTLNTVADESGGVLQFLTDTGDNDNVCLLAGPFDPSQGAIQIEARFKIADTITAAAVFVGFTETLALDTPVMPAEFATATMTYNGTGGMVGLQWDSDATTNAWRALSGDGGAVSGSADFGANGTVATEAMVVDEYDIVRVVLHPGGGADVMHDGETVIAGGTTGLTTTDLFYAVVMLENRSAAAIEFEVDYVEAVGVRDWTV